jgi:hypothetical protein
MPSERERRGRRHRPPTHKGAGQVYTWLTKAFGGRDNAPSRVSHGKSATIAGLAEARQGFRPGSESQTT